MVNPFFFLDLLRTPGPCGMDKGSTKYKLSADKSYSFSWHLGYAHRGGVKIDILDKDGTVWKNLTDVDYKIKTDDPTVVRTKFNSRPFGVAPVNIPWLADKYAEE